MNTIGEQRVLTNFNVASDPTKKSSITLIKEKAAELINIINELPVEGNHAGRWKAEAMTCIETGAMYGVKAAANP